MTKEKEPRTNKTVSFSHLDVWEDGLCEYALDPARGKFGPYVRRLIAQDRDGWQTQVTASPVQTKEVAKAPGAITAEDKASVAGFL